MRERTERRFVSIGTKLSALIFALVSLVATYIYTDSIEKTRESLLEAKQATANTLVDVVAASLVAPLDFSDNDAIQAELRHLETNDDIIYAAAFVGEEKSPMAVLRPRGAASSPGSADAPPPREARAIALPDRIEVAREVLGPSGKRLGSVAIGVSLARESAAYESHQRRTLLVAIGLTFALAGLIIGLTRRLLLTPVMRLAEAARRVEAGAYAHVNVASNDEIGALGGAFNAMATAIVDRERRLASARESLQELLDGMRQAIVVFGKGGVIEGATSKQTRVIFGEAAADGRSVRDLLYPSSLAEDIEPRAFEEWLSLTFEAPAAQWAEIAELAPREVTLAREGEEPMFLELEMRPFIEGDAVARVMLLATDETQKRRLEHEVASRERENALQLVTMRRLIASGPQAFLGFLDGAETRVERSIDALARASEAGRPLAPRDLDELFRDAHTVKGEARSEGLRDLEQAAATIEERLADARARMDAGKSAGKKTIASLHEAWLRAREQIASARRLFVEASPIGEAVLDQVTVSRAALDKVHALVTARSSARPGAPRDELYEAVSALASRPFGECTAGTIEAAPGWALSRGKQATVVIVGREVPLPREVLGALRGAITHLVRNAIAHGIEAPDERERAGKPIYGSIVVRCAAEGEAEGSEAEGEAADVAASRRAATSGLSITIEDDGRGLDIEALRARAAALNVPIPPGGDAYLIFEQGLSTADDVDDLAGRGVGLAAVRAELSSIGWEIDVSSDTGRGTRFALSPAPGGP